MTRTPAGHRLARARACAAALVTALLLLLLPAVAWGGEGSLGISPDPVRPATDTSLAAVTLTWSSAGTSAVEVRIGRPDGRLFARSGPGERSATTGTWVGDGTVFFLQDVSGGLPLTASNTLASATARVLVSTLRASPEPVVVPPGTTTGATTLTWTTAGTTAVEVRVGSPSGSLVAGSGAGTGTTTTGHWLVDGTRFFLQDRSGGRPLTAEHTLATRTVRVTPASLTLTPATARVYDGSGRAATTLQWSAPSTSTLEVRHGAPDGPLVARSGPGPASTTTGAWVRDGALFHLQNTSDGRPLTAEHTLATARARVLQPAGSLRASPQPLPVWDGTGRGVLTLSWEATDVTAVELRTGSPTGAVVARSGPGSHSTTTGPWVADGTTFHLQDVSAGAPPGAAATLAALTARADVQPTVSPAVGLNKFDLMTQYLGLSSEGDGSERYRRVTTAMARKALDDARDSGVPYLRVAITGTRPDAYGTSGDLDLWTRDPAAYWRVVDVMMTDLRTRGIQVIPVFVWNWAQFPAMNGETTRQLVVDPRSRSYLALRRYVGEFVQRYRDSGSVLFYELANELNLKADLDQKARALRDTTRPPGTAAPIDNITTDEMTAFLRRLAGIVRYHQPAALVSSGHSLPRKSAEHLRRQPEWSARGADWTRDSQAEFEKNLLDVHAGLDIASIHIYDDGDHERFGITGALNPGLLDVVKATTDRGGKRLFVGEFSHQGTGDEVDKDHAFLGVVLDRLRALRVPYSAAWVWQFYQRSTYVTYDSRLTAANLEPGWTDLSITRLRETNAALGRPVPALPVPDTSQPRVVVTWPLAGAHLTAPRVVHALASDDGRAATRVDFFIDGALRVRDHDPPYQFVLDDATLSRGDHVLTARAWDVAGNSSRWEVPVSAEGG